MCVYIYLKVTLNVRLAERKLAKHTRTHTYAVHVLISWSARAKLMEWT